jgi:O-antigen/teichoic acid export membrane protein
VESAVDAAPPNLDRLGAHGTRKPVSIAATAAPTPSRGRASMMARMLSGAVLDQAILSAASFMAGLILIRHSSDLQYGYYILVFNAFLLLTSLQNAFIGPSLVNRVTQASREHHGAFIGGLYREQGVVTVVVLAIASLAVIGSWAVGLLDATLAPILLAALVAAAAMLYREYFRIVLFAYRRPEDVLRGDIPYTLLMIAGAWLATHTAMPTAAATLTTAIAAAGCGILLGRSLKRHQHWSPQTSGGILREIAPLGLWSVSGAAIHWTFSQGYSYLVAGTLDVTAVAAIAATRLLMMPVNLLSTGIRSMMLPLTTGWLHHHGAGTALRRLSLFAAGLAVAALGYFGMMWLLRDWLFNDIMQKHFADRDHLLMLWMAIFFLMVVRDQVITLLIARQRFRTLASLTLISAVVSIGVSYVGMLHYGQIGALIGMLMGELVNLAGVTFLVLREVKLRPAAGLTEAQA